MNNPNLYSEANGLQAAGSKIILSDYICHLTWSENEKVLDIGCGPGDTTCLTLEKMLPPGTKIVGCDISEEMVSYANQTYGNELRSFKRADVSKPDVRTLLGGDYDKIFSFYCLHWIKDQRQCMKNIHSLLKQNGKALISIPVKHECYSFYHTYTQKPEWEPYMKNIHGVTPYFESEDPVKDLSDILQSVNFKIVKCDLKHLVYWYSSIKSVLDMMEAVNPYSDKMPVLVREKFFQEMEKYFHEVSKFESDGRVRSDYTVLVAIVEKAII